MNLAVPPGTFALGSILKCPYRDCRDPTSIHHRPTGSWTQDDKGDQHRVVACGGCGRHFYNPRSRAGGRAYGRR